MSKKVGGAVQVNLDRWSSKNAYRRSHLGEFGRIVQGKTHRDQIKDVIAVLLIEIKDVILLTRAKILRNELNNELIVIQ